MPVIGFLGAVSPTGFAERLQAFRQGLKDTGLCGRRECCDRIPLGRQPARSAAGHGGRSGAQTGRSHFHERLRHCPDHRRQGGDRHGPDRVRYPRRPRQARPCRRPRPAGRQPDWGQFFLRELVPKRLELLRELVPAMSRVAVFVNPANPSRAELHAEEVGNYRARDGAADLSVSCRH